MTRNPKKRRERTTAAARAPAPAAPPAPTPAPAKRPTILEEIAALRSLSTEELLARYRDAYGCEPRQVNREHLWKRLAWKLQEARLGGLTKVAKARLEQLVSEIDLPLEEQRRTIAGRLAKPKDPTEPAVGAVLTRAWRGEEVRVERTPEGYSWQGASYRSLSAVAKAVTGQHWNGKLFFGLAKRPPHGGPR